MDNTIFDFVGGTTGDWKVIKMTTLKGDSLKKVTHIDKLASSLLQTFQGTWSLKGVISNLRYTEKSEKEKLLAIQEDLGREKATYAALIPIRKNDAWWNLAQDERRKIMENQSQHTHVGMQYLPAIARKLFHSRDINEPFDFLTWFEFAPEDEPAFNELLKHLRNSEEWKYVDREIDIRLKRV
ncbi:chlorite dismutase family protein [Flavobacterium sp. NG2]|uniref:chlorite dismutase family protein n=1 Tax=Flavobacterium sp. NG2 TaxID=3097547 RepID=UPI002A7F95F0|nr:chlorite dismutase family protein [Flavobacterium sp. NG2]WPR71489.1 chlorite dismutase family protein [Flavobacterium sp. NG2]